MTKQKRATTILAALLLIAIGILFRSASTVYAAGASMAYNSDFIGRILNQPQAFFTGSLMPLLDPPTFEVNSTADTDDGTCDLADCTLREAINAANASPDFNTITFNISGVGVQSIQPLTPLPWITSPVNIEGRSQHDYPGRAIIEINGDNVFAPQLELKVGINITGGGTIVRALAINGFAYGGIGIISGGDNKVFGNIIGMRATGITAVPNLYGVIIYQSSNNLIGGTRFDELNFISGNLNDGINIGGNTSSGNKIIGNFIGVDLSGAAPMGNQDKGIKVEDAVNTTIGGTQPYEGNVIAASTLDGILLKDTTGNVVVGNWIGTDTEGDNNLGNARFGIFVQGGSNNTIGGTQAGAGNVIAFNSNAGIDVEPFTLTVDPFTTYNAVNNAIKGNSIHDNGPLGIDLGSNGVTANDTGDGDTGANNLQNFPVITSATTTGTSATFTGTLNSRPSQSYRIEFFNNSVCDSSGNGEGQTYLGSGQATSNASGNATFNITFALNAFVQIGDSITATATDLAGNTSEFSSCISVASQANASPSRNYFTTLSPTLTWNAVVGAIGYEVEVAANSTFSGTLIVDDILTPDLLSDTVTVPQNGIYFWHVRAQQPSGVWSPTWSITETFTVAS